MKIVLITFPRLETAAGGEQWISEVSCRLSERGNNVTVISSNRGEVINYTLSQSLADHGVDYVMYKTASQLLTLPSFSSILKISRILNDTDVVYFVYFGGGLEIILILFHFLKGTKIIAGFHSKFKDVNGANLTNKIYDAAFGRRGMRFARHFNAFHVINEEDLEFLEKHNFNPSFLIPNGVNTDFFTPCNKNNIFTILFVGRFIEGKGVLRLKSINSAINKIIENYKIILVGEGSCKNRVMSEMQNDNIIFRGWVTGTPLKELFCTSHVLLVPSLDESFSLVTLESLSSGTPVVGSNIVPLNKNIESGINGYLGDDDKALADGILKIYNTWKSDPEGYSKMSSLCREKARKFDWVNEIVPRLSNMLDSL